MCSTHDAEGRGKQAGGLPGEGSLEGKVASVPSYFLLGRTGVALTKAKKLGRGSRRGPWKQAARSDGPGAQHGRGQRKVVPGLERDQLTRSWRAFCLSPPQSRGCPRPPGGPEARPLRAALCRKPAQLQPPLLAPTAPRQAGWSGWNSQGGVATPAPAPPCGREPAAEARARGRGDLPTQPTQPLLQLLLEPRAPLSRLFSWASDVGRVSAHPESSTSASSEGGSQQPCRRPWAPP